MPQQDLGLFPLGTQVTVRFPGVAGERPGVVHHVAFVPDPKTRTYEVVVAVDNADGALRAARFVAALRTERRAGLHDMRDVLGLV